MRGSSASRTSCRFRVPETAAATLAEGEFNRFYVRALCRRAISIYADFMIVACLAQKVIPFADIRRTEVRGNALAGRRLYIETEPGFQMISQRCPSGSWK